MYFYLRRMFFCGTSFFIVFMYLLRTVILNKYPSEYEFQYISFINFTNYNYDKIPKNALILFVVTLYIIIIFFCPKVIKIKKLKHMQIYKKIFILQNIIYFILISFFSLYTMGKEVNITQRIIIGLIENILGRNFLFIIVLIDNFLNKKNNLFYMFIYICPTIVMGSKSGIILCVLYYIFLKIGFKEKIINLKILIISIILYIFYPLLYSLSWIIRLGGELNFSIIFKNYHFLNTLFLLSKRVTGIDILMFDRDIVNTIDIFTSNNFFIKILCAIFTRGMISKIINKDVLPYVSEFSKYIMNQKEGIINAFEPTLFGVFYYSSNPILLFFYFHVIIFLFILIIKKINKKIYNYFLIVLVLDYVVLILHGNYPNFFINFRFIFIFLILSGFFNSLKLNKMNFGEKKYE